MSGARRTPGLALALLLALGGPLWAQGDTRSIEPGMTVEAVRAELGPPLYERTYGDHTYYFYDNGCEKTCGFLDLVVFQGEQVIDAVFRAPWHHYTGESSSPKGIVPKPTPGGERLEVPDGAVEGVEVRPRRTPASSRTET